MFSQMGVCDIKPMDDKTSQMTLWESDQFIVPGKQGNACGGRDWQECIVATGNPPYSEMTRGVNGPDHPRVAIRVNNLGSVLKALGDLQEARKCYERALNIVPRPTW